MRFSSRPRRAALLVPALAVALALTGCGSAPGSDNAASAGGLKVVATTTQLTDFTKQIGGDDISLTGLLPVGGSAHHFDPSPKELLALGQADVLVVNGAGLEGFLDSAIQASGFSGKLITAADGIDLAAAKEITAEGKAEAGGEATEEHDHDHADHDGADHNHAADHDHGSDPHGTDAHGTDEHGTNEHDAGEHGTDEHDHDHGDTNPHIWTSPRNAIGMVGEIAKGLAAVDPAHAKEFEARAGAYEGQLKSLDTWVAAQFARVPADERVLVSGHDSLRYFLHDYGIAYAGAIMPSFEDNAEPSAADIDALVKKIKERGVRAIFVESSMSPKLAQTIAREAGVQVIDAETLFADSLGAKGSGGETYIGATIHNTQVILKAWGHEAEPVPDDLGGAA